MLSARNAWDTPWTVQKFPQPEPTLWLDQSLRLLGLQDTPKQTKKDHQETEEKDSLLTSLGGTQHIHEPHSEVTETEAVQTWISAFTGVGEWGA